jgi:hypothetical protein
MTSYIKGLLPHTQWTHALVGRWGQDFFLEKGDVVWCFSFISRKCIVLKP